MRYLLADGPLADAEALLPWKIETEVDEGATDPPELIAVEGTQDFHFLGRRMIVPCWAIYKLQDNTFFRYDPDVSLDYHFSEITYGRISKRATMAVELKAFQP